RRAPSRQSASVQLGMVGGRSRRRTLIGAGFKANVSVWGDLVGFDPVSEPPPVTYPGTGGASRRSPNDCWRRPITSDLSINLHVWMPPLEQEVFGRRGRVIGCGHVSGLFARPVEVAGRYGDARAWRRSRKRAVGLVAN